MYNNNTGTRYYGYGSATSSINNNNIIMSCQCSLWIIKFHVPIYQLPLLPVILLNVGDGGNFDCNPG